MLDNKCITIDNLIVIARHGCNEEEKKTEQPFSFSLKVFLNFEKACNDDNLESTISYSAIAKSVEQFCKSRSFNLLEKLASETCRMLMDTYEDIQEIQIELKKIKPPTMLNLSSFGVSFSLKREIVYLGLGSSLGDKRGFLNFAVERIKLIKGVRVLKVSDFIETDPYGGIAKNIFLNGAVKISTYLEPEELLECTGKIEFMAGRKRTQKWVDRTLDIDIIFFGDRKIFTDELVIPHYDWENRDFIKKNLRNIDPFIFKF